MVKTLILYQSKYGFTKRVAKSLSLVLGPAANCRITLWQGNSNDFEIVVICTPIYFEMVDHDVLRFVSQNAGWLKRKKVILVCTCLEEKQATQYLQPLHDMLGESVLFHQGVAGELVLEKLDSSDYTRMKQFCEKTGFPFRDYHLFDQQKLIAMALDLKKIKDQGRHTLEEPMLAMQIRDFIGARNTCTLATGHAQTVRATPIEYLYMDDCLYLFSEGGEKFANLLSNPHVSVGIYDTYKSMNELGGMQITGIAEMIDFGTDEYHAALSRKGLSPEKIASLPVVLNLIKIHIIKVEFLWSGFAKQGYDVKQIWQPLDGNK